MWKKSLTFSISQTETRSAPTVRNILARPDALFGGNIAYSSWEIYIILLWLSRRPSSQFTGLHSALNTALKHDWYQ